MLQENSLNTGAAGVVGSFSPNAQAISASIVQSKLSLLDEAISSLDDSVVKLREKLQFSLAPNTSRADGAPVKEPNAVTPTSELAFDVTRKIDSVYTIREVVLDLIERVEL